jgi:transposase
MAKTLEKDTVAAIEHAILTAQRTGKNADLHAIAGIFNCTYQSVCYIRRRLERHQRTGIDDRKRAGRKPLGDHDRMAASIRNLLAKRPELDQSAISDYLFDEFGVRVCQATVSRLLKKNGIPHKISNKLYKKSKLFTTNLDGKSTAVDECTSREVAASALSSLPTAMHRIPYKSPYPPRDMASAVMSFNALPTSNAPTFEESHTASSNDMIFSSPAPAIAPDYTQSYGLNG